MAIVPVLFVHAGIVGPRQSNVAEQARANATCCRSHPRVRCHPLGHLEVIIIAGSTALNRLKQLGSAERPLPDDCDAASADTAGDEAGLSLAEVPVDILSPREHLVMRLLFEDGYDAAEVASSLGIAAQTVRALKHRAVTKLRAHLGVDESKGSAV